MVNLASGHATFNTMQSLFRAMVKLAMPGAISRPSSRALATPTRARSEDTACSELTRVGNLLLDALRLEQEYSDYFADFGDDISPHEKQLEQWRECRRMVELLTEDYVAIISKWRGEIEREIAADGRDVSMLSIEALLRSSPNC